MKLLLVFAMLAAAATAPPTSWRYVAPDSRMIVSMDWRRVLDSPYSAQLRREIPPEAAAVLKGINFIEGIEHALLAKDATGDILVLEGKFDFAKLRELATTEGATVESAGGVEIVVPEDAEEEATLLAFVPPRRILLGRRDSIDAAVRRAAQGGKGPVTASGADLYVRTPSSWVALKLDGRGVQATGRIDLPHEVIGIGDNGPIRMSSPDGKAVLFNAEFLSKQEFEAHAGKLREFRPAAPPAAGKIKIYGLEEGVREIPMPQPSK